MMMKYLCEVVVVNVFISFTSLSFLFIEKSKIIFDFFLNLHEKNVFSEQDII